jgi:hypothetical protein
MIDSSSNPGSHGFARSHSRERKIAETSFGLWFGFGFDPRGSLPANLGGCSAGPERRSDDDQNDTDSRKDRPV